MCLDECGSGQCTRCPGSRVRESDRASDRIAPDPGYSRFALICTLESGSPDKVWGSSPLVDGPRWADGAEAETP
jgi:hypothetical protein